MAAGDRVAAASPPFVLTLELDGESFASFEALRRRYYARQRNLVSAHVTLFHALPGTRGREIKALLAKVAGEERPLDVAVDEARGMERGVAVFLKSPHLHALRQKLLDEWLPWLSDQDRAGFRPHVTIQANVSDAEARRTIQSIDERALPRQVRGLGLHLWRYRDGPWESERLFRFTSR